MGLIETYEFEAMISDITNHDRFLELKHELHHGISRYEHSLRVAKMTYKISKKMNIDYERTTRAALLHDFFFDSEAKEYSTQKKLVIHPELALTNASKYFDIDKKQANIISSHMFPLSKVLPKYKESLVVSLADKLVATHEMYRYKASLVMGIWIIFLFNMITIQK